VSGPEARFDTEVQVSAIAPGSAKLVLTDHTTGEVIDRAQLTVKDASTIAISPAKDAPLAVMGGPVLVKLALHDAAGHQLIGSGAVAYAPDPGITVAPHWSSWANRDSRAATGRRKHQRDRVDHPAPHCWQLYRDAVRLLSSGRDGLLVEAVWEQRPCPPCRTGDSAGDRPGA
jgi:hypothetical protein